MIDFLNGSVRAMFWRIGIELSVMFRGFGIGASVVNMTIPVVSVQIILGFFVVVISYYSKENIRMMNAPPCHPYPFDDLGGFYDEDFNDQ